MNHPNLRRKKLIEVGLPLKAINEATAREKPIWHVHPSTLHPWWARRPLAACPFQNLLNEPHSLPRGQVRTLVRELRRENRIHLVGTTKAALWYPGTGVRIRSELDS